MYSLLLLLHNWNRWLVLLVLVWTLYLAWQGWLGKAAWSSAESRAGAWLAGLMTLQFVLGLLLYIQPAGIAQAALRDTRVMMEVREFQFFGLEHPTTMLLALIAIHVGWARSRKIMPDARRYHWAALSYTLAALLILSAMPWTRPLLRGW